MGRPKGTFNQQAPKYRLHKRSGQAIVTLNGRDVYLGKWGETPEKAPESWQEYDRAIGEWLLRGRQALAPGTAATVEQVIAGYLDHYRQERGKLPDGYDLPALRWLRRMYGDTPAEKFSPVCFKAMRMKMAQTKCNNFGQERERTLCRRYINHMAFVIKKVFAWATEVEMVPPSVHYALTAVKPLKRGQGVARESARILPVDQKDVDATLEVANATLAAMIKAQLFTGARCGEICQMRGCDIDMSNPRVWRYTPQTHKTQHHGHRRTILIGPQAQEVIRPFLRTDLQAYIFSPAEGGMTRIQCRKLKDGKLHIYHQVLRRPMRRKHRLLYSRETYGTAIRNAVRRADRLAHERNPNVPENVPIVKRWHSHQLRHSAATFLRREFGLDVAQAVLGHSSAAMTELYAEIDYSKAEAAMMKVG